MTVVVGLDRLLAKSLDALIRENLGNVTIQKIENRLFEKYGLSLTQSIEQFHKLDAVLREFFGAGADGIEHRVLKSVCEVKLANGQGQILIEDPTLTKIILESFGDEDKKKILGVLNSEPLIISQVITNCNIPQTSGYRKVNALINDGLLAPSGHVTAPDGKKVTKYKSIFDNIKIDIIKNKIIITLNLSKKDLDSSSILSVCTQN
jgi:hypothetical protein